MNRNLYIRLEDRMALRHILTQGDPTLNKKCRPVTDFNARLHQLLDDMADTLAEANGTEMTDESAKAYGRLVTPVR